MFTCAHQVRKYAYRMKQNVFNRFHILIWDHCWGYICFIVSNANLRNRWDKGQDWLFKFRCFPLCIQINKVAFGLYFCRILDPAAVQDWTKFPSLITNVLLQLVRDVINGVCYQRYEKHLEQQKGCQMLMFPLQKKIGKRNYCIIKSVIDYCLKSNMHTRCELTIRLKKLKPRAPDFWVPKILGARTVSTIAVSNYICIFVLVQRTFLYYAGNKWSLYKNEREKLEANDDVHSLFMT